MNTFPTTLNDWDPGETIESAWADALEAKIGINNSEVATSLDYLVKNTSSSNPGHKHTLANGATDITATVAEVNVLSGIPATLTSTELGYLDGVTSAIQTQLNAKQASDADLTAIAALSSADGNFIVGSAEGWVVESGATVRTSLGLGTGDSPTFTGVITTGNVGIGVTPTNLLDILGTLGTGQIRGTDVSTNTTVKNFKVSGRHYTNIEEDIFIFASQSTSTENIIYLGGSSGLNNAATSIQFYTAENNTTTSGTERMRIDSVGNIKFGGTADRAGTVGTNVFHIFNGTAPVGTLANGCSIYSTSGELRTMDAAGNATLQTPHDDENCWVFDSVNTVTGKRLVIDMEKMMRKLNEEFGWDFVHELIT